MGIIIAYYSGCYELRRVLSLPDHIARLFDNEIKESLRDKAFRQKFDQLKHLHSNDFVKYVDGLPGVR
jgi:hypothetical protein